MVIFVKFWVTLGHFGPFRAPCRYPEFQKCFPMHYFLSYGFQSAAYRLKHCFLCFFQRFWILNASFGGYLGVSEGPKLVQPKNDPKNTWYMFIGSNYTPVQKSRDGPFFWPLFPAWIPDRRESRLFRFWSKFKELQNLSNPDILVPFIQKLSTYKRKCFKLFCQMKILIVRRDSYTYNF